MEESYKQMQKIQISRGVGKAHFNMATWGVAGVKTPEVRPLTAAYVLLYYLKTKFILNYLKRGERLHPDGF